MQLSKKYLKWICVIAVIVCFIVIGLKRYKAPENLSKSFSNMLVLDNMNNKQSKAHVNIDAKFYRGEFVPEIGKFAKVLEGTVTINNEKYYLLASDLGELSDNIIWGDLRVSPEKSESEYAFYLTRDTNTLYIRNIEDESFEIISPVKDEVEYNNIKKVMYGEGA